MVDPSFKSKKTENIDTSESIDSLVSHETRKLQEDL